MAYTTFSKTGVTPWVAARTNLFPVPVVESFGQIVGQSEAGTIRVATLRPPITMLPLHFELEPEGNVAALRAFFHDALIHGQAYTFTYTDTGGTSYTVRLQQGSFTVTQTAPGLYTIDLVLRVETPGW